VSETSSALDLKPSSQVVAPTTETSRVPSLIFPPFPEALQPLCLKSSPSSAPGSSPAPDPDLPLPQVVASTPEPLQVPDFGPLPSSQASRPVDFECSPCPVQEPPLPPVSDDLLSPNLSHSPGLVPDVSKSGRAMIATILEDPEVGSTPDTPDALDSPPPLPPYSPRRTIPQKLAMTPKALRAPDLDFPMSLEMSRRPDVDSSPSSDSHQSLYSVSEESLFLDSTRALGLVPDVSRSYRVAIATISRDPDTPSTPDPLSVLNSSPPLPPHSPEWPIVSPDFSKPPDVSLLVRNHSPTVLESASRQTSNEHPRDAREQDPALRDDVSTGSPNVPLRRSLRSRENDGPPYSHFLDRLVATTIVTCP